MKRRRQKRGLALDAREAAVSRRELALHSRETLLRDANEHLVVATVNAQAMTEIAQQATAQMSYLAQHDVLTDLPNRAPDFVWRRPTNFAPTRACSCGSQITSGDPLAGVVRRPVIRRAADRHPPPLSPRNRLDLRSLATQRSGAADSRGRTNSGALLKDRLAQALELARRHHRRAALLYLDVDHFKPINDALGHQAGDELLQSIARRLWANVRSSDTVSRQGGDEFVVLLAEVAGLEDAVGIATHLLEAMAEPHLVGGQRLSVGLSIGISLFPDDGDDAETLLRNADAAMFGAKKAGRGGFQVHTPT